MHGGSAGRRRRKGAREIRAALLLLPLLATACAGGEEEGNLTREQVAERLAELRIEPGLWERRTEVIDVRAKEVPRELMQRLRERGGTSRHCIKPDQAAQPQAQFLAAREGARCTSRSFAMENGRMTGEMVCTDPRSRGEWTARLDGSYGADAYDLDLVMEMPSPFDPGQLLITNRVSGRRVGDCQGQESRDQSK